MGDVLKPRIYPGDPNFIVFPDGRIFSHIIDDFIAPYEMTNGYLAITTPRLGVKTVHSMVAETFLEKPFGDKDWVVDHKDENKKNNSVENLEWVTRGENLSRYAQHENRKSNPRRLRVGVRVLYNGEYYKDFKSLGGAARGLNATFNAVKGAMNLGREMKRGMLKGYTILEHRVEVKEND